MAKTKDPNDDPNAEWADGVLSEVVSLELACARHVLGDNPQRLPTEEQSARIAFLLALCVQRSAGSDVADALSEQRDEGDEWKRGADEDEGEAPDSGAP